MAAREIRTTVIVGMGALGILFGAQIQRSGGDVRFALDHSRMARYAGQPVTCNGVPCRFRLAEAASGAPADLVIVAVKSSGLASAMDAMARFVGPETIVISVMNGISSERILNTRFDDAQIVPAVAQGMDAMRDGCDLTYSKPGEICIGAAQPAHMPLVRAVKDYFDRMGVACTVEPDIRRRMWGKFMLNVGINQVCAAYETTYAGALSDGPARQTLLGAMREVIAIGAAEGVSLGEDDVQYYLDLIGTLRSDGAPSMRQDTLARRRTEVDLFAGTVREIAARHGIPVPANDFLYHRIKELEASF